MKIRAINGALIREILTPDVCIDLMDHAMREVSLGRAELPLRWGMPLPSGNGALGMMPGYISEPECLGIKLVSLFPGNPAAGLPPHLGLMLLYEAEHGQPIAMLDANVITALRTAAASGLATRELARPESSRVAIIGTGEQAESHVPSMLAVRDINKITVWGRNRQKAAALALSLAERWQVAVEARGTVHAAVERADIICTVTSAAEPVLKAEWIPEGAHLNLVGSSTPDRAEVDSATVIRGSVYVDFRTSTMNQAGELLKAIEEGQIDESHIRGEIGQVLMDKIPGRQRDKEITIYKSLGVAAQDLVAAEYVFREVCMLGCGQIIKM